MEIRIKDEFIKLGQALKLAGVVVFDGTALSAILTLFNRIDLEQMIFIVCITPFLNNLWFL